MARINVEDDFWNDNRLFELGIALGCRMKAVGACICAIKLAQQYWCKDKSLIPKTKYKAHKLPPELIECGFIEEREHGFYFKGSEKHFDWIMKKKIAGMRGGKKSAQVKSTTYAQANSSKFKQIQPSISISNSISNSNNKNILTSKGRKVSESNDFVARWNKLANDHGLAKVMKLSKKRLSSVNQLKNNFDEKEVDQIFKNIAESDFLIGKSSSWKCNFDWCIKITNATKILEGNYQNRTLSSTSPDWEEILK